MSTRSRRGRGGSAGPTWQRPSAGDGDPTWGMTARRAGGGARPAVIGPVIGPCPWVRVNSQESRRPTGGRWRQTLVGESGHTHRAGGSCGRIADRGGAMAETTLLEKTAELVANAQNNVSDASPHLAEGIAKEATRFTPPIADDVMKMAGHVFDFAQRAPETQRTMVDQLLASISKSTDRQGGGAPPK